MLFLNLNIRRSHMVSDSLNEIARKQQDLKKKLKVTFHGEAGTLGIPIWVLGAISFLVHEIDYHIDIHHVMVKTKTGEKPWVLKLRRMLVRFARLKLLTCSVVYDFSRRAKN